MGSIDRIYIKFDSDPSPLISIGSDMRFIK